MKKFTLLSAFFAVFMLLAAHATADDPPYEVLSLSVAKPTPGQNGGFNDGTVITLLVRSDDLAIVGMNELSSKVTSFEDDKKNNLLDPEDRGMFAARTQTIGDGGKWATVEFRAPNRPAAGCKSVTLKAEIVLEVGAGSVVEEHKDIPLSGKGKFKAGGVTVTVKKGENPMSGMRGMFSGMLGMEDTGSEKSTSISLESKKSFDMIKEFSFFNAQGGEIKYRSDSWSRAGDYEQKWVTLAEEVETVTIKTDAYEKLETLRIPVSVEVGVGF